MATPDDVKLEEIRETAKTERQKNLISLITNILSTLIGLLNTFLLVTNHTDTVAKVQAAKTLVTTEVQRVYDDTPSFSQVEELAQKVDATNLQWKAYNSKKSEDINVAADALVKVDPMAARPK